MTKLEQAARLALDALLRGYSGPHTAHYLKAIEALREALAEPTPKEYAQARAIEAKIKEKSL